MKLYLVRHGDAMQASEDMKRSLSDKGQEEVATLSNFLKDQRVEVEQIYHSGILRAEQTAIQLSKNLIFAPNIDPLVGLLPDDPVKPIAVYCNHWQNDTMIVGHLPFLGKLASEILLDREDKLLIDFKTASILCLERIAIFQWSISWFVYPALLYK